MSVLERWVIPGVVAIAAVVGISLYSETQKIETDLTDRSQAVLQAEGIDWAKIAYTGRDGTLTGVAPEEGAADSAIALLQDQWGVRVVDDKTDLLSEQKPFTWGLERSRDKLSMIGYLPYTMVKTIPELIKSKITDLDLANSVEAARGAPERIADIVALSSDILSGLPEGKAMLIDDVLTISGSLEDGNAEHVALFSAIKQRIDSAELGDVSLDLQITEPKKPEPASLTQSTAQSTAQSMVQNSAIASDMDVTDGFAIKRTADGVDLRGVVPSDDIKGNILALAHRKFGFGGVADNLLVKPGESIAGLSADAYTKVTEAALQAVSRLGEGEASLSSDGLTLTGGAFYEGALAQLKDFLSSSLPQGLSFNSNLSVAAPGEAVAAEQCQSLLRRALEKNTILFNSGEATISRDSFGLLDGLIYTAHRCPDSRVQVEGHTDSDGDDALNQTLSDKRAGAVVNYLVAAGITMDRLSAKGFGETRPVADNGTPEGKAKNRRIEFVILNQ